MNSLPERPLFIQMMYSNDVFVIQLCAIYLLLILGLLCWGKGQLPKLIIICQGKEIHKYVHLNINIFLANSYFIDYLP